MAALASSTGRSPAHLAATRAGWHRVAEHVLAAALYAATGEITLVPAPGGFATPPWGAAPVLRNVWAPGETVQL